MLHISPSWMFTGVPVSDLNMGKYERGKLWTGLRSTWKNFIWEKLGLEKTCLPNNIQWFHIKMTIYLTDKSRLGKKNTLVTIKHTIILYINNTLFYRPTSSTTSSEQWNQWTFTPSTKTSFGEEVNQNIAKLCKVSMEENSRRLQWNNRKLSMLHLPILQCMWYCHFLFL